MLRRWEDHVVIGDANDCWLWDGALTRTGYGNLREGQRNHAAHRRVYELVHGPIPAEYDMHHACERRACVNPSHLRPLSRRAHTLTKRCQIADQMRRTHCPRGHLLDYEYKGHRDCTICRNERSRKARA